MTISNLDHLHLTARSHNALTNAGVKNASDLFSLSYDQLSAIAGVGDKAILEFLWLAISERRREMSVSSSLAAEKHKIFIECMEKARKFDAMMLALSKTK